ncbi:MAG TPA: hypothetical protein VJ697_02565 [Nitrososphaeraceae archaeon]|nr:hypothetical protein [Nitrososphaeraceae archaeon]
MPKAYKIFKCNKCFRHTFESFFNFQEIDSSNKFGHSCYFYQQQQQRQQLQQNHYKDNYSQIQISKLQELLLSVIDYRLKSENKLLLKMIVFPDYLIENALLLKILISLMDLMDIIETEKDPLRWLFELVENDGFVDLGEIGSGHWIQRAYDSYSTNEKATILKKEELKQFITITKGTFGLIKFRKDKKIIYTFCYLPLDNEKTTRQDFEKQETISSHRFSESTEQEVVVAAEEENQQRESVAPLSQIDKQHVGRNSDDAIQEAFEQYIEELNSDPGIQQIIASTKTAIKSYLTTEKPINWPITNASTTNDVNSKNMNVDISTSKEDILE